MVEAAVGHPHQHPPKHPSGIPADPHRPPSLNLQQHDPLKQQPSINEPQTPAADAAGGMVEGTIPAESELVLLCLDYLRGLRRSYHSSEDMLTAEGLKADYITLAIYSLSRAFASDLSHPHNDPWMKPSMEEHLLATKNSQHEICNPKNFPSITDMTKEVMLTMDTDNNLTENGGEEKKQNDAPNDQLVSSYEYDDSHPSNAHRFFLLQGLSSGPTLQGPLSIADLTTAGLDSLQARSRVSAEQDMIAHPLFAQFLQAVKSKGFFKDEEHETPKEDPKEDLERRIQQEQVYNERFSKVVSKFRSKLAAKAQLEFGSVVATNTAEWQQARRLERVEDSKYRRRSGGAGGAEHHKAPPRVAKTGMPMPDSPMSIGSMMTGPPNPTPCHPADIEEAERTKSLGNSHMQKKEYQHAAAAYTKALKMCPTGPNSHVYYSNRAAALLSMKKFSEAIADSERSLTLKPDYGKAHARLGLAHFLLGDYRQAMEAYTVALKYEPNNKGAQSYLEKAAKRVAAAEQQEKLGSDEGGGDPASCSFSVVSEWDRCDKLRRAPTTDTSPTASSFSVVGTIPEEGPQHQQQQVGPTETQTSHHNNKKSALV